MPRYTAVLQSVEGPRLPRGHAELWAPYRRGEIPDPYFMVEKGEFPNIVAAAQRIAMRYPNHRLVHVEEDVATPSEITDEQIIEALAEYTDTDFDDLAEETRPLYEDTLDFLSHIDTIATALRESQLVPGLDVSLIGAPEMPLDYAMIEVRDEALMHYRSVGTEIKHLIDERDAVGLAARLSIARALIALSHPIL